MKDSEGDVCHCPVFLTSMLRTFVGSNSQEIHLSADKKPDFFHFCLEITIDSMHIKKEDKLMLSSVVNTLFCLKLKFQTLLEGLA